MSLTNRTPKYTPTLAEIDQGYTSPTTFNREATVALALGIAGYVAIKEVDGLPATLFGVALGVASAYKAIGALDILTTPDL